MFFMEKDLIFGATYTHNDSGLRYQLVKAILRANNYEITGKLEPVVAYIQLDGGKMPAGTEYTREPQNFKDNFILVSKPSIA